MKLSKKKINFRTTYLNKIVNKVYDYRYLCAVVILIVCVLLEISGSSIGTWKDIGASDATNDGVLFGISRPVRSDEYAVLTPMIFSQKFNNFKYYSDLIRGDTTDVFIVFGLPVINFLQIFRPFQLGFLFLGLAKGLSLFWCGRLIALFLVTLELFMLISNKNKTLSFIGAMLVTLSPIVQWWFAINGIAEIFIFGSLAILLLDKYMLTNNRKKRFLYLLGIIFSGMGYILVFYPAWQIPMLYVFFALSIWIILKNWKKFEFNYKDIIQIVIALIMFGICIFYLFTKSLDTIKLTMNTVYPGLRFETGGQSWFKFFEYPMNIFLPFKEAFLYNNNCGKALMFTLFPIELILSIKVLFQEKNKDPLLIILLLFYVFFVIWIVVGFPPIIAKITLMSKSPATRTVLASGFLSILILIRSLAILQKSFRLRSASIISIIISLGIVYICKLTNNVYVTKKMCIVMLLMCFYLFFFLLCYKRKYAKYMFLSGITFVMVVTGLAVNPVRKGIDVIYESSVIKEVQKINDNEEGLWVVEGLGFPMPNYLIMAGASVLNSTNVYPDLDRWQLIDSDKKYTDVYNRYAHIFVSLTVEKDPIDKFQLVQDDVFSVKLTPEELKQLNVKYIFTGGGDLTQYNTKNINFEKLTNVNGFNIYKVNY